MNEPDERTGQSPRAVSKTQCGFDEEEPPGKPRHHSICRDVPAKRWNDWRWKSPTAIRSARQLRNPLHFPPEELDSLEEWEGKDQLATPPSPFSLRNPDFISHRNARPATTSPLEAENPAAKEPETPSKGK